MKQQAKFPTRRSSTLRLAITFMVMCSPAVAQQAQTGGYAGYGGEPTQGDHLGEKEYSPYLDIGYPQRVFWGDTHVHTSFSTDAGMLGNRLGPDDAYRFARGETVVSSTGVRASLQRPLDFLVVADHSENLGLAPMIAERNPDLLKTELRTRNRRTRVFRPIRRCLHPVGKRHDRAGRSPQGQRRVVAVNVGTSDHGGRKIQ